MHFGLVSSTRGRLSDWSTRGVPRPDNKLWAIRYEFGMDAEPLALGWSLASLEADLMGFCPLDEEEFRNTSCHDPERTP